MKLPVLFRRRSLLLPTLPGVIFILGLLGLLAFLIFRNVATFLAVNKPVDAEYLVIEGWLGKYELKQAYKIFDAHDYKLVVVSGGPITDEFNSGPPSFAQRARDYLLSIGFPEEKLFAAPAPYSVRERTLVSAVTVKDWFTDRDINVESLDILSGDVHARRSRDLYRFVFGEQVDIGVYASTPEEFDLNRWWQSSDAAKSVVSELLGWLALKCCFSPGQPAHVSKSVEPGNMLQASQDFSGLNTSSVARIIRASSR